MEADIPLVYFTHEQVAQLRKLNFTPHAQGTSHYSTLNGTEKMTECSDEKRSSTVEHASLCCSKRQNIAE
jgi:hypothetical protein